MFVDLTVAIMPYKVNFGSKTSQFLFNFLLRMKKDLIGHLGTHLDCMKKEFPVDYFERKAIVFDVSQIRDRDIDIGDIDFEKIKKDMCVVFHTGYTEEKGYGNKAYFQNSPQLSNELIDKLLEYKISLIAIDCAAIRRRNSEHIPKDQLCADHGVFVIENICNLRAVLENNKSREFIANTYPSNYIGVTGLPCRMAAKI